MSASADVQCQMAIAQAVGAFNDFLCLQEAGRIKADPERYQRALAAGANAAKRAQEDLEAAKSA